MTVDTVISDYTDEIRKHSTDDLLELRAKIRMMLKTEKNARNIIAFGIMLEAFNTIITERGYA